MTSNEEDIDPIYGPRDPPHEDPLEPIEDFFPEEDDPAANNLILPDNSPPTVDPEIYRPLIDKEILNLKKGHTENWSDPTWKYAASVSEAKTGATMPGMESTV